MFERQNLLMGSVQVQVASFKKVGGWSVQLVRSIVRLNCRLFTRCHPGTFTRLVLRGTRAML
jgi:hypothetical protein